MTMIMAIPILLDSYKFKVSSFKLSRNSLN